MEATLKEKLPRKDEDMHHVDSVTPVTFQFTASKVGK